MLLPMVCDPGPMCRQQAVQIRPIVCAVNLCFSLYFLHVHYAAPRTEWQQLYDQLVLIKRNLEHQHHTIILHHLKQYGLVYVH